MLQKTKAIALSVVILLHLSSVQHALTLDIFPNSDDFQLASTPRASTDVKTLNTTGSSLFSRTRKRTAPRVKKVKDVAATKSNKVGKERTGESAGKKKNANSPGQLFPCKASLSEKKKPATTTRKLVTPVSMKERQAGLKERVRTLARRYHKCTGQELVFTSKGRTPTGQAKAMFANFKKHGTRYVIDIYRKKAAAREIANAYKANRRRPRKAVREMSRVIQAQLNEGIFISNHLRGLAVDVRSRGRKGARLWVLRQIALSMGGSVLVERDHFHVELT